MGLFRTKYGTYVGQHRDLFRTMLFADYVRGKDSTGVAVIHSNGAKAGLKLEEYIFKRAIGSPDFIEMKGYYKVERFTRPVLFMGHNRAATKGSVINANAHPFEVGDIILAHNGTLTNKHSLPDHQYYDTDSENIAHLLNTKSVEEVANLMEGAWALVWWNKKLKTLNFLRNNQRTFYYTFIEKGDTMLYGSSEHIMRWSCEHNKELIDGETDKRYGDVFPTEVNELYTFTEGSTEPVITEIEIKEKPKPPARERTYWNGHSYGPRNNSVVPFNQRKGGTSAKKERKAAELHRKQEMMKTIMGGMVGQTIPFSGTAAHDYENKTSKKRGRFISGKLLTDYIARVLPEFIGANVSINSLSQLPLREINKHNKDIWAGTVTNFTVFEDCKKANITLDNVSPFPQYDIEEEIQFLEKESGLPKKTTLVKGPEGILIPCTDFKIMTSHGCAGCGRTLQEKDAPDLLWIENDWPVCQECVSKEKHLGTLGSLITLNDRL